jgi:hypothetical protein
VSRPVPARLALLAVALGSLLTATHAAKAAEVTWTGVERVVAFADVHGAHAELVALLQAAGVVDGRLRWSAGKAHVVSTGDLLDRGADSRKVMDLLMRLQGEAGRAGGRMHVVLGNHEAMNVLGDLRYVIPGEFAAYAADEDPAERARQKIALRVRNPDLTDAEFDRRFPPGYFGHRRLLGPDGRYGRWLLGLPVAIRVNDTVYMHGGPSLLLHLRSLEQLNRDYGAALANYAAAESALTKAGLLSFEDVYARRLDLAHSRLASRSPEEQARLAPLVERFRSAKEDPLLGPTGPNWYRGAALCNECAEADVLEPFLAQVGARRVVVGHTTARNGTVVSRFDGAVVKLDAGMNHAVYAGRPAALVSDAAGSRVAYASPATASAPPTPAEVPAEPLYLSSQKIGENAVADLLAQGSIEVTETCAPGVLTVRVSHGEQSVDAVFEATDRKTAQHELAAYRLDRLLGLGLVPATVARKHAGKDGVLQGRPARWASEQDQLNARNEKRAGLACQALSNGPTRAAARRAPPADGSAPKLPTGGHCDLGAQFQLAYAFDALIGNPARTPDRFLYDTDATTLFLSGHGAAFGRSGDVPKALEAPLARTGPELQGRLRRLDLARVQAALGESVPQRDVEALLKRRDRILELARPGVANPR